MKRICPNDPDATRKLKECEKAVQKIRFEEAISVGDTERRSIADSLDYHIIGIWSLNFHIFWHFTISRFDIYVNVATDGTLVFFPCAISMFFHDKSICLYS